MAEKVEILEIETGNSEQTLRELKDQIKELRNELDGCTIGSDKFKSTLDELTAAQDKLKKATKGSTDTNEALEGSYDALTKKMSELKKAWRATADEAERADLGQQISDINNQLKDMDSSIGNYQRNVGNYGSAFEGVTMKIEGGIAKFENFNNVTRSVIGSFDLVEGGLKAIGVESEEVSALMDTMQGAMMFTNGLNSIKEGFQAFTKMKTAVQATTAAQTILNTTMLANPIGAIVAGVAALIAGVTALVAIIRKNRDEEEKLAEAYEATNKVIDDRISAQSFEIELMKAKGVEQAEILKQELEYAKLNAATTKERIAAIEDELENTKGMRRKKKQLLQEQLQDLRDQLEDEEDAIVKANNAIIIYDTKCETERTAARQDAMVERARIAKEEADAEIAEAERARKAIMDDFKADMETREEYWMNEMQREEKRLKEEANRQRQNLYKARQEGLISPEKYREEWNEISKILDIELKKLQDKYVNADSTNGIPFFPPEIDEKFDSFGEKLKNAWKLTDTHVKGISAGVNLLGTSLTQTTQLLDTLANSQDQSTEEGFNMAKKLNIASATMQMFNGIVSAWSSAMQLGPIAGPIMGGVLTAFTTSLGILNINKIKSQTFKNADKTNVGSSNVTPPAINTAALLSSPINYTTEVKGAQAEEMIPQKVYVVESDITSTQTKVKTVEDESTF